MSHIWVKCLEFDHSYYRPRRSWGKVTFSEACVKNSVPRQVHPPGKYTPGQDTPLGRYTPGQVHTPPGQVHTTPQGRYTHPPGQVHTPGQVHAPLGRYTHPRAGTPPLVNQRAVRILLECILVHYVIGGEA